MIDLKRSYLVVNSHPKSYINQRTVVWYMKKGMPLDNFCVTAHKRSVVESRNTNAEMLMNGYLDHFDWIIFMDQDNYPTQATEPFLDDVPYDVVGCCYDTPNEVTWSLPESIHMGCVRVRTSVLKGLELPWFKFEYNEPHTKISKCECGYFRDLLINKGATVTRRGFCGHHGEHTWHGK